MRVPTWVPCRLQFYFNGHQLLAWRLRNEGSDFSLKDGAFLNISDIARAQKLAEYLDAEELHKKLDVFAKYYFW
ncbi:MAG: hypothetical protein ACE5JB_02045 [bacterium]